MPFCKRPVAMLEIATDSTRKAKYDDGVEFWKGGVVLTARIPETITLRTKAYDIRRGYEAPLCLYVRISMAIKLHTVLAMSSVGWNVVKSDGADLNRF